MTEYLFMFKYEDGYRSIIFVDIGLVKQVVYKGKFKVFGPSVAWTKKFKFALVNHEFGQSCIKKILTNNHPHISTYADLAPKVSYQDSQRVKSFTFFTLG